MKKSIAESVMLMLSIDESILTSGTPAHIRMLEYGALCKELYIIVWTMRGEGTDFDKGNVHFQKVSSRMRVGYYRAAYRIANDILKKYPDALITSQDPFTNILALFLMRKFKDARFQVQVHTDFLSSYFRKESFKNKLKYLGYLWGIRRADCVRVVSSNLKRDITKTLGISESKISVVPIFVDIEKYRSVSMDEALKKKYDSFSYVFLVVSRLTQEKGVLLALEGMRDALKADPRAGLLIVGGGPERCALETRAHALGLEKSVVFLGKRNDVEKYYATADAVLVPSFYEGYGLVIIEALSAGRAVLSTDVGVARAAGAMVVLREDFGKVMARFVSEKIRTGTLKQYPYRSQEEYLGTFKEALSRCLS